MAWYKRKNIPMGMLTVLGLLAIFSRYIPIQAAVDATSSVWGWVAIMGTFTVFLGTISLVWKEYNSIVKKQIGWEASILFFVIFLATVGMFFYSGGANQEPYYTFFTTIFEPLDGAIWSTLAFMVVGAFLRTFRARSWESLLLVVAVVFVTLTNASIGEAMWTGFPEIGEWILSVPAYGAARGSAICAALGTIILGMRILLGYEKRVM